MAARKDSRVDKDFADMHIFSQCRSVYCESVTRNSPFKCVNTKLSICVCVCVRRGDCVRGCLCEHKCGTLPTVACTSSSAPRTSRAPTPILPPADCPTPSSLRSHSGALRSEHTEPETEPNCCRLWRDELLRALNSAVGSRWAVCMLILITLK